MRIAHLSDLHVLDLGRATGRDLWGTRRGIGMLTMLGHRTYAHNLQVLESMIEDVRRMAVDHVIVSGDVTLFALDAEFEGARRALDRLGMPPERVSVVPGNHDTYTPGSLRRRRFAHHFVRHISSDIPVAPGAHPSGPFPYVRLAGEAAIIGLSSAVERWPTSSAGRVGRSQTAELERILAHEEVRGRLPLIVVHHPLIDLPSRLARYSRGLEDAVRVRRALRRAGRTVLVVHGHLHERCYRILDGTVQHIGATSATFVDRDIRRMAAYNIYDVRGARLATAASRVWNVERAAFVDDTIP